VSLVDGFNLPMAIIPTAANCPVASCPIDLNPQCPAQLVGPRDPTGLVVGCNSACSAGLDNAGACLVPLFLLKSDFAFARGAADSANCCTGTHSTQTTCPSSGVDYYAYFSAYSSSPPSSTPVSPFLTSPYRPHPEGNCPNAYVYAFDGGSGTSLWTCPSTQYSDYKVTFCPCVLGLSSLLFVTLIDCCWHWHVIRAQTSAGLPSPCPDFGRPCLSHPVRDSFPIQHDRYVIASSPSSFLSRSMPSVGGTATQPPSGASSPSPSKSANSKSDARHTLALMGTTLACALLMPGAVAGWLLVR
jgi:hypothetical protein